MGKKVILRFVRQGEVKKATLTYIYPPPKEFWEDIKKWIEGEKKLGKAEKFLTVNIIVPGKKR